AAAVPTYRRLSRRAALLAVATVVAAAAFIGGAGAASSTRRQQLMIVAAGLATFSLIQFPFAAPIYFCYATPLLALVALAVVREIELPSLAVPGALAATFIAFALVRMYPGYLYNIGLGYARYQPRAPLPSPRGGDVRILAHISDEYSQVVDVVRRH